MSAPYTHDIIIGIIIFNTGISALPDISALTLRHCTSSDFCVHIRQSTHACITIITFMYTLGL